MTRLGRGIVLALGLLVPLSLRAQEMVTPPDSGARVRLLRAGDRTWQEATFLRVANDTLQFQPPGCCVVEGVPLSGLRVLEVSRGKEISTGRVVNGMLIGTLAGGVVGALAGKLGCDAHSSEFCGLGEVLFTYVGAGVGFVVGTGIGLSRQTERWERVYPPERAALWVVPGRSRGVMVGLTVPFEVR